MKRGPHFKVKQLLDGVHELIKPLGAGQDGEVWCAENTHLGKTVAIKLLNTIKDEDKLRRFENEIEILVKLNHPHIIYVFGKGKTWNPTTEEQVPYYIMEYIDALPLSNRLKTIPEKDLFIVFCTLFDQSADALITIHDRGITHGDIKSANLMVYKSNTILKIADFGFGIPAGKTVSKRKEYPDSSYRAPEGFSAEEADVYKLGRTLQDCINELEEKLSRNEVFALGDLGEALINNPSNLSLKNFQQSLEEIKELHYTNRINYYLGARSQVPEVTGSQPSKVVVVPTQGHINLSERVTSIIDLEHFQKLHWIRELTPAFFVYPSANHTYFDSTLGQYGMTIKYFNMLGNTPGFNDIVTPLHIRTAIILSLINKVGQYSFSSQIYRATGAKEHDPRFRSASIVTKEPFSNIISRDWDLDPGIVASILTDDPAKANFKEWRLILSILDGPISAPALHFLIHTASDTGLSIAIDVERFLYHLRLSLEEDQLAINLAGLSALEAFHMNRYMIMERVFFHHTFVALDRMLVQSFRELHKAGLDFEKFIEASETEFINTCIREAQSRGLNRAENLLTSYTNRNVHRRVVMWPYSELKSLELYDNITFSVKLEKIFSRLLGKRFTPGSIIFDSPTRMIYTFDVPIINESDQVLASVASPTIRSTLERLQENAETCRLFASREVADSLQNKFSREEITNIILK